MENKEIYIDGVDMSGCCCYENGKCLWTKRYYENNIAPDCEKVKDCYFKQLKRLEQEDKQMKSALEEINILAKNYCNACDEFKAKTYKNKNDCLYCNYGFIKRKINEVLQ